MIMMRRNCLIIVVLFSLILYINCKDITNNNNNQKSTTTTTTTAQVRNVLQNQSNDKKKVIKRQTMDRNKRDAMWKKVEDSKYKMKDIIVSWDKCKGNNRAGSILNPFDKTDDICFAGYPSTIETVASAVNSITQHLSRTFSLKKDTMPTDTTFRRRKFIHPLGSVAKIKLVINDNSDGYTGLFKSGAVGLARIGWAAKPTVPPTHSSTQPIATAIKLFHGGDLPSSNTMFMYSLDGQKSCNVLAEDLSNHLPIPKSSGVKVGSKLFITTTHTPFPNRVGLASFAAHDNLGNKVKTPHAPYRLILKANPKIRERIEKKMTNLGYKKPKSSDDTVGKMGPYCDMRVQLSIVKPGTKLFDVYAVPNLDIKEAKSAGYDNQCALNHATFKYVYDRFLSSHKAADSESKYKTSKKAYELLNKLEAEALVKKRKIGEIIVESDFIGNKFGDQEMFFEHEFFCPLEHVPTAMSKFKAAVKSFFGALSLSCLHGCPKK